MENKLGSIGHLMNSFDTLIENAKNDPMVDDYFCGDVDAIRRSYIEAISAHCKLGLVIMTKEEYDDKMMSFYDSMEGM
jgi:hypothetical protein